MSRQSIPFTKMAGAGNDFILIEVSKGLNYRRLAEKVCHRTNGIGADGLLILDESAKANYRMRIINADGSEAEMCGNGARCMAAYIAKHKNPEQPFSMETLAGLILARVQGETANVRLSDPKDYQADIPLTINQRPILVHRIDTGVPHAVVYVDGLADIDVKKIGQVIRFHKQFAPRGTNVNFVEQQKLGMVEVRTYERGVEDETRACGTGSVASAIVSYLKTHPEVATIRKARMKVLTASGEILAVTFGLKNGVINDVWLKGSAKFIAEGTYYF
jgi:diaminopimelate epimerase